MVRKAFVADEATREKVRYLAGLGLPQDDIAKIIRCAPKTLRKRFRDELDRGIAEANAMICGYLFAAAKAGNTTAQIFWLKTRAGWREDRRVPQHRTGSPSRILRRCWFFPTTTGILSSPRCCAARKQSTSPVSSGSFRDPGQPELMAYSLTGSPKRPLSGENRGHKCLT
jgi:hypothetical protein